MLLSCPSNGLQAEQDFRNMAARSVSTGPSSRTSPKASGSGMPVRATTLVRSGSMNLPRPADSGVPAVHPDMCIVRIRRNHLLEAGPQPNGASGQSKGLHNMMEATTELRVLLGTAAMSDQLTPLWLTALSMYAAPEMIGRCHTDVCSSSFAMHAGASAC